MSQLLESVLAWARAAPWPGAWIGCQLSAALAALLVIPRDQRMRLLCALPFGVAGAYLLGFVHRLPTWLDGTRDPFGVAAWGALAGTALGYAWLCRRGGTPLGPALDRLAPSLAALVVFGRLGCFFAGCESGRVASLPWAVRFPRGTATFSDHAAGGLVHASDAVSLAVHPAQLYESLGALLLFFVLRKRPSLVTFVAGYAALRSAVELLRGEPGAALATSLGVFAAALLWIWRARASHSAHESETSGLARIGYSKTTP